MNMIKKLLFVSFLVLVLLSFVSALEVKKTEVVINTDPYQNMSVVVKNLEGGDLQTFAGRARKFGEYRFTYYAIVDKFKISVSIVNNDTQEVILSKDFGPYTSGNLVNVTLKLFSSENVVELPLINSLTNKTNLNASANETAPSSGLLTGKAVDGKIGKLSPVYYYVIFALFGIGIFVFLMRRRTSSFKTAPNEPNHEKMFSQKEEKKAYKEEFAPSSDIGITASARTNNAQELKQKINDLQKQLEQIHVEEDLIKLQRQVSAEQNKLDELRK